MGSDATERAFKHLLEPSRNPRGQDPLDELYKEVLGGYFKGHEARDLFRSVVGQLITSHTSSTRTRATLPGPSHTFAMSRSIISISFTSLQVFICRGITHIIAMPLCAWLRGVLAHMRSEVLNRAHQLVVSRAARYVPLSLFLFFVTDIL